MRYIRLPAGGADEHTCQQTVIGEYRRPTQTHTHMLFKYLISVKLDFVLLLALVLLLVQILWNFTGLKIKEKF